MTVTNQGHESAVIAAPPAKVRQAVALGVLGATMEFYDFTVYGFVAAYIGATFFATGDPYTALLSGFAVFAVGFIARPLGAFILGPIADRLGRKSVMVLTMLIMAGGTLLIGCAPGYDVAGPVGATMVVIGRLAQGFSTGGEQGPSSVFIVEWAYAGRRGFFGSFQNVAAYSGLLLGVLISAALTSIVGPEIMMAWAWRVPFFIGVVIAVVAFYIRLRVADSPVFESLKEGKKLAVPEQEPAVSPASERLAPVAAVFLSIGLTALGAVTSLVALTYLPSWSASILGMNPQEGLWATVIGAAVSIVLIPLFGAWSDRLGRRVFILVGALGYLLATIPLFVLMESTREFWALLVTQLVLAPFTGAISGALIATYVEMFSAHHRAGLVAISQAIGVTLFGGFGTYICTWLIGVTGNPVAPSFYITAVAALTTVASLFVPRGLGKGVLKD